MRKIILVTIFLVFGSILGWSIARSDEPGISQAQEDSSPVNNAFEAESSNLRLTLNQLFREHAVIGAMTLTALFEGDDISQMKELMNDNQNQLAMLIQNAYGIETRDRFAELWSRYMAEEENYTQASKNNRTADMSRAKQNLEAIAGDLGRLFDDNGDNLDGPTVTNLIMEHINGTLAIVDAVDMKDPTVAATLVKASYDQAGRLADALARGIILDKPDMFTQ